VGTIVTVPSAGIKVGELDAHVLDVEAGKLREAAGPSEVGAVGASHRAWAAFRYRWCELQAARDEAPHPQVNQYFCSVELTRDYIVLIRKAG
jgi:hypothetical protein